MRNLYQRQQSAQGTKEFTVNTNTVMIQQVAAIPKAQIKPPRQLRWICINNVTRTPLNMPTYLKTLHTEATALRVLEGAFRSKCWTFHLSSRSDT